MRKIAKAFSEDEWKTVLAMAPADVLAGELVDRATNGERILTRMRKAWEEESKAWN